MRQDPAAQELPELAHDEARETTAVRLRGHGGKKLAEVRAHDGVEHPVVGDRGT